MEMNPYRAALVAARGEVLLVQAAVRVSLARPRRVLAQAWQCPAADEFACGLGVSERAALRAIEDSLAELDAKIRAEPELVSADAWQLRWRGALDSADNPLRGYG